MDADPWLERWLPLIGERIGSSPVLELGCGPGLDTQTLVSAGHRVIAIDRAPLMIADAQSRVPSAEFHRQDLRDPFPLAGKVNVVLASLALHYFPWCETQAIVARIHEVMVPQGILLFRANSTEDHNYGASGSSGDREQLLRGQRRTQTFFRSRRYRSVIRHRLVRAPYRRAPHSPL